MNKLSKILIALLVIIIVLVVGKNIIVKVAVEKGVRAATGLPLKIEKFHIGLFSTQVGIEGLSLFNPSGFPHEAMFHAPEIFIDYHLGHIIKGNIHLQEVRLHFDEFVVVTNAQGQTNLKALQSKGKDSTSKKKDKGDKRKKAPKFQIDRLSLKVGKVIYKDYSKGAQPLIKEFNINISEKLTNVRNPHTLLGFIATKALAKTTLNNIMDLQKDVINSATEAPKQIIDSLRTTTDALKDKIKLPFGVE